MKNALTLDKMYSLTVEESAVYFRIGENKIREIIKNNPNAKYILHNGNRTQIKRKLFEDFLDNQIAV